MPKESRKLMEFYEERAKELEKGASVYFQYDPQGEAAYLYDDRFSRVKELVLETGLGLAILDVGCGDGWVSSLYREGNDVYGLDLAETNVKMAQARGINVVRCDAAFSLPFKDNIFDVVVCSEVLEHIFFPEELLMEIRRVLKRKGVLICTVPNLYALENRLALLLGNACKLIEYPLNKAHIRHYSVNGVAKMLEECGFSVQKILGESFAAFLPFLYYPLFLLCLGRRRKYLAIRFKYMRLLGRLFPNFAAGLIFKAVKS